MKTKKITVILAASMLLISLICAKLLLAQAADEAKTREIMDKVITALGGAEKLAKIKNYAIDVTNIRVTETELLKVDSLVAVQFPDKSLIKVWARRGEVIAAVDGDKGWIKNPPKELEPMSEKDVKLQRTHILRDIFYICRNPHLYNIRFMGEKDWYKKKVLDLLFTGPSEFHLYIDPETYLPAGSSFYLKLLLRDKPVYQEELYYDYKEIDGVQLLHRQVSKVDGRLEVEYTVNRAQINLPVDEDFFKGKGSYVHLSADK
jgi:hypothetical protein